MTAIVIAETEIATETETAIEIVIVVTEIGIEIETAIEEDVPHHLEQSGFQERSAVCLLILTSDLQMVLNFLQLVLTIL